MHSKEHIPLDWISNHGATPAVQATLRSIGYQLNKHHTTLNYNNPLDLDDSSKFCATEILLSAGIVGPAVGLVAPAWFTEILLYEAYFVPILQALSYKPAQKNGQFVLYGIQISRPCFKPEFVPSVIPPDRQFAIPLNREKVREQGIIPPRGGGKGKPKQPVYRAVKEALK